jgi:hypothetical protein
MIHGLQWIAHKRCSLDRPFLLEWWHDLGGWLGRLENLGRRAAAPNESPFKPDFPLDVAGRSFEVLNGFVVPENPLTTCTLYF